MDTATDSHIVQHLMTRTTPTARFATSIVDAEGRGVVGTLHCLHSIGQGLLKRPGDGFADSRIAFL